MVITASVREASCAQKRSSKERTSSMVVAGPSAVTLQVPLAPAGNGTPYGERSGMVVEVAVEKRQIVQGPTANVTKTTVSAGGGVQLKAVAVVTPVAAAT